VASPSARPAVTLLIGLLSGAVIAWPGSSHPAESALRSSAVPGTTIDRNNLEEFASLMPPALRFAVQHGLTVRVVKARSIRWPVAYQRATEQYSSQVHLDARDAMQNYVAGLPFPMIEPADPKRPVKIAYNWHWGPFIPPQINLSAMQKTRAWRLDPHHPKTLIDDEPQRDFRNEGSCEQIVILRYTHTLRWLADSRRHDSPVEFKQRGDYCGLQPNAYMMIQYLDPDRSNDAWFFPQAVRRWRRMKLRGGDPHQRCTYACAQFWWEYVPPKTEAYTYRLIGEQPLLACMDAKGGRAGIERSQNAARFGSVDCEVRAAFVLELIPQAAPERILRSKLFLDKETYLCLGAEFYREQAAPDALVPMWSRQDLDSNDTRMFLADDYYVPGDRPLFFLSLNMEEQPHLLDADEPSINLFNPRIEGYRIH
jgi:hypothetical protein